MFKIILQIAQLKNDNANQCKLTEIKLSYLRNSIYTLHINSPQYTYESILSHLPKKLSTFTTRFS